MISTTTKREAIRGVPAAWDRAYRSQYGEPRLTGGRDPHDIYTALRKLNLDTCAESEIERVIGNSSWTRLECDHCGDDSAAVTTFQGPYASFSVCRRCLIGAASGIEAGTDATPKSDAAEGESPVPQGDAQ